MIWPLLAAASAALWTAGPAPAGESEGYHCRAGFQENWVYNEFPEGPFFRIKLGQGDVIRWDGIPVSRATLRRRLDAVGAERRPNFVLLAFTEETDCTLVQEIRVEMTRRLRCAQGRCGEHFTTDHPRVLTREEEERLIAQATADLDAAAREVARVAKEAPNEPDRPERR
jgi:hypothetical protein